MGRAEHERWVEERRRTLLELGWNPDDHRRFEQVVRRFMHDIYQLTEEPLIGPDEAISRFEATIDGMQKALPRLHDLAANVATTKVKMICSSCGRKWSVPRKKIKTFYPSPHGHDDRPLKCTCGVGDLDEPWMVEAHATYTAAVERRTAQR